VSRVQLALNVSDLDAAIDFYSKLFASTPAKVRAGYANFAIADPPLKLVLIESREDRATGISGALNHLGVEVEGTDEVVRAANRLTGSGLAMTEEHQTTCCHALQDKVWTKDPDATPWEIYTVLADDLAEAGSLRGDAGACCDVADESPANSLTGSPLVPRPAAEAP
jgi:catechol 2,3-dioxygenase-like lactoylglutathione lyase family enzyme